MKQTEDIRLEAFRLGRKTRSMAAAFRLLEAGDEQAVRVFAALSRDEWGTKAAMADGIAGVDVLGVTYKVVA